jgi:molecular chaperone DnaK
VIAKDISLEVVRAGRRDRRVLISRGTGLPTEVKHRFFTADQSGAVVLRILQNRVPIKTLLLQVPKDLPIGTAVELMVKCDEAMRLEARAVVAGLELWAQVEPSQLARFDQASAVDSLLEEADKTSRSLWGADATVYRREAERLTTGIREVVSTDPDKLSALCQQLRHLVDEFKGDSTEGLSPPWHRFEGELDGLRRLVYRSTGVLMGMDRAGWDARIDDIETRARTAYEAADAVKWRRVYNEVQALYETAHQEEFASMKLDDPAYIHRRFTNVGRYAQRVELALTDFVPSASDDVRALQVAERDRLLTSLKEKVLQPLSRISVEAEEAAALRRKLEAFEAEIERVETALERIPAIGLPTERGG